MPTNLYEATNLFELYDVNGVILTNPNDFILIHEPDGFKEARIKLKRDKKNHGFDYEFSDSEAPYGFDKVIESSETLSPFELLVGIFSVSGIDGKAILRFKRNGVLQYEANLDFETLKLLDYMITMSARRINLDDLFRTRFDTPVNFGATTSIDGTSITGITANSMFLHSKEKLSIVDGGLSSDPKLNLGFILIQNTIFASLVFNQEILSAIPSYRFYNSELFGTPITDEGLAILGGSEFTGGFCEFTISTDFNLNVSPPVLSLAGVSFVGRVEFQVFNDNFIKTKTVVLLNQPFVSPTQDNQPFNVAFNLTNSITELSLKETDSVYLFFSCTNDHGNQIAYNLQFTTASIDIVQTPISPSSVADVYNPFDSFNHVLEVINNGTNLLISDFWSNVGDEIYLTNGYKIRGFDTRNVIVDFKTIFENWAQPSFGLGFAIVDSGGFKVLMERYEHFYQDVEIDAFTVIEDDEFEISIDKDLIFNEIDVGYKEFPKSTDDKKVNNIDEFNTKHLVLTPVETRKKKATYVSEIIASGYKIENQRTQQFKEIPEDTVADDDKEFCIKGRNVTDFDTIAGQRFNFDSTNDRLILEELYAPILTGDIIDITGTTSNDGTYTVTSVETGIFDLIPAEYLALLISLDSAVVTEAGTASINIDLNTTRLIAERNQAFDVLSNVISPETVYNVGLNPVYMRFNQSVLLNSGFNPKPDTSVLKVQEAKLNGDMSCQFKIGEGGYILDPDKELVTMGADLQLKDFNSYNKLFSGILIKFRTTITYDRVLAIRSACLNEDGVTDYGYISMTTPGGVVLKGFIMSMDYNPMSEQVDFVLRHKFDPSGSAFDYILDAIMN